MAVRVLENSLLRVSVSDDGAELISVLDKQSGEERIWQADPAVWNRHAPILFPFVGKVTEGKYRVGGREYSMKTQHGFARDLVFDCLEATESTVLHCLTDSEWTRERYPFSFRLLVRHRLDGGDPRLLHVEWELENPGEKSMYYAIGAHPGFLLPPGEALRDCFVAFPGKQRLEGFRADPAGFALPDRPFLMELVDSAAPCDDRLPETWIFQKQGIDEVQFLRKDRSPYVSMSCPAFPLLAVWAKEGGPFLCLEPWYGRTDDVGFTGTLAEKACEQCLEPGEKKHMAYSMKFHA